MSETLQHERIDAAEEVHHHPHGAFVDGVHTVIIHGTKREIVDEIHGRLCKVGDEFPDIFERELTFNELRQQRLENQGGELEL